MLTFDEPTHTYRWDGRRVPSVTQLLEHLHSFAGVPLAILLEAQQRGTYVHQMCELYDRGELDEQQNAHVAGGLYVGYLDAWKRFIDDFAPNWEAIEERGYSRAHGFAGTKDRRGGFERRHTGSRWVCDIKTGRQAHRVWGLQTAAYRQIDIERDASHARDRRATVQLGVDGRYRFIEWNDPADWPTFHALLTLDKWSHQ